MKGLLLKDFYVLRRQAKFFFLILLILALLPSGTYAFSVVYGAMVPYTTIYYDEQSGWDRLSGTLPCRLRVLVLEKYLLGLFFVLAVSGLVAAARLLIPEEDFFYPSLLLIAALALVALAVNLPLMIRLGTERGRMVSLFLMIAMALVAVNFLTGDRALPALPGWSYWLALPAALAVCAVSYLLAVRISAARR